MANLKKIRDIARSKRITLRELAEKVGITEAGLYHLMSNNTTKIDTLEKIAKELDVSLMVFLDEGSSTFTNNNIAVGKSVRQSIGDSGQVEILKRELEEARKEVKLLRKIIKLLESGKESQE